MPQGIGAVFGGLAEGIKAGYGLRLAGQELGLKQQQIGIAQQSADVEAQKMQLQLRQFDALQSSASALNAALLDPLKGEQKVAGALEDFSTLRDLATVDPAARKALVAPWVQSWANKNGVQVAAPVVDTLSRMPSDTLVPVIDQITAAVNSGDMGLDEVGAALADPAAFAKHFAGYAAAAKANTPTDGSIAPNTLESVVSPSAMQYGGMKRRLGVLDQQIARVEAAPVVDSTMAGVKQKQLQALYQQRNTLVTQMTTLSEPKGFSQGATVVNPAAGTSATLAPKSDVLSPAAEAQRTRIAAASAGGSENARIVAQQQQADKAVLVDPNDAPQPGEPPEQALAKVKPELRAKFQAWYDGRAPIPQAGRNNPRLTAEIDAFNSIYPDADANKLAQRRTMITEFTSQKAGTAGGTVNSVGVLASHMLEWRQAIAALGNGDVPGVNALKNWARTRWGDGAPTTVDTIASKLAEETTRFYRGAGGAEADIDRNINELAASFSSGQADAKYNAMAALLFDKLRPLKTAWDSTMQGVSSNVKIPQFVSPAAKKAFLAGGVDPALLAEFDSPAGSSAGGGAAPPAAAAPPKGMVRVRLKDGRTGMVKASEVGQVLKDGGTRLQ